MNLKRILNTESCTWHVLVAMGWQLHTRTTASLSVRTASSWRAGLCSGEGGWGWAHPQSYWEWVWLGSVVSAFGAGKLGSQVTTPEQQEDHSSGDTFLTVKKLFEKLTQNSWNQTRKAPRTNLQWKPTASRKNLKRACRKVWQAGHSMAAFTEVTWLQVICQYQAMFPFPPRISVGPLTIS